MFFCMGGWYSLAQSCSAFRSFSRLRRFLGVMSKPRLADLSLSSLGVTTQWFVFLSVVPIVSFFFAWVKCNSYNLGRLCVVVARLPSQVAPAQILSSFWWEVVHGSSTTPVSPRPCAVHSSLVWFAHSSLISKELLAAHEISLSLQTLFTW